MNNAPLTAKAAILYGYRKTVDNLWFFIKVLVLQSFLINIPGLAATVIERRVDMGLAGESMYAVALAFQIIAFVLSAIATIGILYITLGVVRQRAVKVSDIVAHWRLLLKFFWTMVVAGALPMLLFLCAIGAYFLVLLLGGGQIGAIFAGAILVAYLIYVSLRLFFPYYNFDRHWRVGHPRHSTFMAVDERPRVAFDAIFHPCNSRHDTRVSCPSCGPLGCHTNVISCGRLYLSSYRG